MIYNTTAIELLKFSYHCASRLKPLIQPTLRVSGYLIIAWLTEIEACLDKPPGVLE